MTIKEPRDQGQSPIRTHSGSSGMAPDRSGGSKDDQKVAAATGTCLTLLFGECSTTGCLFLYLCQLGNRETGTGLHLPFPFSFDTSSLIGLIPCLICIHVLSQADPTYLYIK